MIGHCGSGGSRSEGFGAIRIRIRIRHDEERASSSLFRPGWRGRKHYMHDTSFSLFPRLVVSSRFLYGRLLLGTSSFDGGPRLSVRGGLRKSLHASHKGQEPLALSGQSVWEPTGCTRYQRREYVSFTTDLRDIYRAWEILRAVYGQFQWVG